jgi:hypothetical protein
MASANQEDMMITLATILAVPALALAVPPSQTAAVQGSVIGSPLASEQQSSSLSRALGTARAIVGERSSRFGIADKRMSEVELGIHGSNNVYLYGEGAVKTAVEVVYAASVASKTGKVVGSGTLKVDAAGNVTYSQGPADKLVVVFADGSQFSLVVRGIEGDFSRGPGDFVQMPYGIDFSIDVPGQLALDIVYIQRGNAGANSRGALEGQMKGFFLLDSHKMICDVKLTGEWLKEVDGNWVQLDQTRTINGSIAGGGIKLTVSERNRSIMAHYSEFIENYIRETNNTWTAGSAKYGFQALIKKAFKNGRFAEQDYWTTNGQLTKNGAAAGKLALQRTATGVAVVLVLSGGGQVVMEEHK